MHDAIVTLLSRLYPSAGVVHVEPAARPEFGHYSTNLAMRIAKEEKRNPLVVAQEIVANIEAERSSLFDRVEAVMPGFVNFWIARDVIVREFARASSPKPLSSTTVMVEFTDPNPFKLFHIGHLMSNAIGESLSRLHEAAGATVIRANYQGDIGLHVAMSVWAMHRGGLTMPAEDAPIAEKTAYLGRAYAAGSKAYRSETEPNPAKAEIETVNKALYEHSDPELSALYHKGRAWSLEYFEEIYARLGTKFARYFFESEVGGEGKELVMKHPEIFPESDGARVFHGEPYGLHTRVFVNSRGLPTYEAKELGLNKRKFELYPDLDRSIIVTGNEIADYFKVLLKAMELVVPQAAAKTRHVAHGMLRLPTGKMSSRTGDVVTADSLIEQTKEKIGQYQKERTDPDTDTLEQVAIGAIKYSILKQNPGQDIIFDFEKSLSVQGESGPYLQYTHARFSSVLRKASEEGIDFAAGDVAELSSEAELACMRKIVQFDDAIALGVETLASSHVARYLFELANLANKFYELMPVMKEERTAVRLARLLLVSRITETLAQGLHILGIQAPARM